MPDPVRLSARLLLVATLLFSASACGGREAPKPGASPTPAVTTPKPSSLASDALVRGSCAPDAQGIWAARGVVKNRAKAAVKLNVVVQIGPADGQPTTARVKKLGTVASGKSASFVIEGIDAPAGGPCHLQVRYGK